MKLYSLPPNERIKGSTLPSQLFLNGAVMNEYPVHCRHMVLAEAKGGIKVLVAVPRKRIKKAVTRNRIRRQMREAWRLNVGELRGACIASQKTLLVGLYFQTDEKFTYSQIEEKIKTIIHRLLKHHETPPC